MNDIRTAVVNLRNNGSSFEEIASILNLEHGSVEAIAYYLNLIMDNTEIKGIADKILDENPLIVEQIKNGKVTAIPALVGQAKKINPSLNAKNLMSYFKSKLEL